MSDLLNDFIWRQINTDVTASDSPATTKHGFMTSGPDIRLLTSLFSHRDTRRLSAIRGESERGPLGAGHGRVTRLRVSCWFNSERPKLNPGQRRQRGISSQEGVKRR